MYSNFRFLITTAAKKAAKYAKITEIENNIFNLMSRQYHSNSSSDVEIIDVDIDKMMYEDPDFAASFRYEPKADVIDYIAPMDAQVEGIICEELKKDNKERWGSFYGFKGLKN